MKAGQTIARCLLDHEDSILVLVDIQQPFLDKLPEGEGAALVDRICWLLDVALLLGVPVVAMAEEIPKHGSAVPEIVSRLPDGCVVHDKMIFGLASNGEIISQIKSSGRGTVVMAGLETDVCVAHSALGLLAEGFQLMLLADATASPGMGHEIALERMRGAGAVIGTVKSVYYEWVRSVAKDDEVRRHILEGRSLPKTVAL